MGIYSGPEEAAEEFNQAVFGESIPQGLKPDSFWGCYWHD